MVNVENRTFLKLNCEFIRYLSEMKAVSMSYDSSLFWYFLQLVSTVLGSGDI